MGDARALAWVSASSMAVAQAPPLPQPRPLDKYSVPASKNPGDGKMALAIE
jgi:hypothetical protein